MKVSHRQFVPFEKPPAAARKMEKSGRDLEAKKLRLKKATREFESFFILHMLKAMRSTIPKSGFLENGLGGDIYNSMFDLELAKKMAGGSPESLAEVLYRSLEKNALSTEPELPNEPAADMVKKVFDGKLDEIPVSNAKSEPPDRSAANFKQAVPRIKSDPVLKEYGPVIEQASRKFNLNPRLIYSVIMAESGGDPGAISPRGARGLMQLMDTTAAEMGVSDSLNPHQNIEGGAKYLRRLLDKYDGDLKLALAAYNAGPGTVSKYNGVPPFSETNRYIEKVLGGFHNSR